MNHDLTICLTLKAIHSLDSGQRVELKWIISQCGEVDGGDMTMRLSPAAGKRYMLGDKLFINARVAGGPDGMCD